MEKIVRHSGVVSAVEPRIVHVQMRVVSACASCEAHSKCGFAEAKDKIVDVETSDWKSYQVGDPCTVTIRTGNGVKAVLIAYVLPAAVLLAAFIAFSLFIPSEGVVALLSLAVVCLYGLVLYLFRSRLQRQFSFSISKRV